MRVTSVHVERRKSDNAYGNRMMAVTAELDEGEDPGPALDDLAALVRDRIEREERADEARREAEQQARMAKYRAEQEEARARLAEQRAKQPDGAQISQTDPFGEGDEDDEDDPGEEGGRDGGRGPGLRRGQPGRPGLSDVIERERRRHERATWFGERAALGTVVERALYQPRARRGDR